MAIDTKAKRASVQNYAGRILMRPPPDGTVGTADRPVLAWLYAGMTYSAGPANTNRWNPMLVTPSHLMNRT